MKKIGEYTMRGKAGISATPERLILFDGRFDTGYRVTHFEIASVTQNVNLEISAKLLTDNDGISAGSNDWNWDNNEEIAWAAAGNNSSVNAGHTEIMHIDPDHMIVEDLYIKANSNEGDEEINYMIKLEKYDISDGQGALAMVRNRSQA
jgi:hypothetical protein